VEPSIFSIDHLARQRQQISLPKKPSTACVLVNQAIQVCVNPLPATASDPKNADKPVDSEN
jgi:hypothetical protein